MATGFIWAHIARDGSVNRKIGNVSSKRVSDGTYQVQYENIFSDAAAPVVTCYFDESNNSVATIQYTNATNKWEVYTRHSSGGDLRNANFSFLVVGEL
jgi:hypothetical protein